MKKNIAMRVAAFLFILTMISTCAFATTFAKYTTGDTATDEARVAKWGVTVVVTGDDAFNTDYATHDTTKYTGANSVSATGTGSSRENLVAPGTNGDLLSVTIEGTPEVATEVKVEFTFDLGDNWGANGYYCPLEIKVNNESYKGTDYGSADEFEQAVINAVLAAGKNTNGTETATGVYTYDTNKTIDASITVTWAWAFEGNDDAKDTILGSAAAVPTIEFDIKVTVTQID